MEHVKIFPGENRQCDLCDARSQDRRQWHPIQNAIDGSNRWWQSPTLTNGYKYNYVTITLDLRQVRTISRYRTVVLLFLCDCMVKKGHKSYGSALVLHKLNNKYPKEEGEEEHYFM